MKNKAIALALLLSVVGCSESNKEATEEAKKEAMMEMEKAEEEGKCLEDNSEVSTGAEC